MSLVGVAAVAAAVHVAATWLRAVRDGLRARRPTVPLGDKLRSWPSVSVIVPAWNESMSLPHCIRSVAAVDYEEREIIVVAGGADGSYELACRLVHDIPQARALRQQPSGKNAALNEGLRSAGGEVIVLLDADSAVPRGWLRALVAPLGGHVVASTGRWLPFRRTAVSRTEEMEQLAARHIDRSHTLNGAGSIALRRDVIERLGGFPVDVLVGVDWDLDSRLAAAGLGRAYAEGAAVTTQRPATLAEYWTNEIRWRRAHLASIVRHGGIAPQQRLRVLAGLYIYGLAWAMLSLTILVVVAMAVGSSPVREGAAGLWLVAVAWLALRRLSLPIRVAAYTGDHGWLRLAHMPPLLLTLSLAAMIPATLTVKHARAHFRGPRPTPHPDHAG